jgi:protein phosphatase 2C family protein 2/3
LSRALGDFEFKKNYSLIPQKQVITSDPDVTAHEITNEDEFFVLACDGIWDCLTSQQVVDFIRLKISEGKVLSEISEEICEYCLAPDTSSGTGIGCDNMTLLIIAILNGKTKQEWYDWVTDRVKTGHGFRTPNTIPQIYSSARLMAYKARREAQEERERLRSHRGDDFNVPPAMFGSTAFSGFARVLGSTGGISFSPSTGIVTDTGARLMFADDDDDSGDEIESDPGRSFFTESFGLGRPVDPAASLRDRLAAYEKDMKDGLDDGLGGSIDSGSHLVEIDDEDADGPFNQINGDVPKPSPDSISHPEEQSLSSEAPSVPLLRLNGDVTPVQQLQSPALGDEFDPVIKAEGLMDTSEDPLVA